MIRREQLKLWKAHWNALFKKKSHKDSSGVGKNTCIW